MRLISHRLRGFDTKEQTLTAFNNAIAKGVNAFEIDLRKCKTGEIIVNHDATLKREYSINELIRNLEYDPFKHVFNKTEYSPVLFSEVLKIFSEINSNEKLLLLDIKEHGYEQEIYDLILHYNLSSNCIIVSWLPNVLKVFSSLDSNLVLCFSHYSLPSSKYRIFRRLILAFRNFAITYLVTKKEKTKLILDDTSSSIINAIAFTDEEHIISDIDINNLSFLKNGRDFLCINWKEWSESFDTTVKRKPFNLCFYNIKTDTDLREAQKLNPDIVLTDNANHFRQIV